MQGSDPEETPNEVSIIIAKRNRKYQRMMHGQCCNDNCGCCPDLKPPPAPGPNENCMVISFEDPLFLQNGYRNLIQT